MVGTLVPITGFYRPLKDFEDPMGFIDVESNEI